MPYTRPEFRLLPTASGYTEAFWTGGRARKPLLYRHPGCWHLFRPPRPLCWARRSRHVAPAPVSGRGRGATFTVNAQPWLPSLPPPYVVVLVELEEQPDVRIMSQLVDIDPAEVAIGMEVEVFFEQWSDEQRGDIWLPLFRPAGGVA